jgi:hypothetical protein
MPLTASGTKVLRTMKEHYGAGKGERIFYATGNKQPALGKKWHGTSTSKRSLSKR